MGASRRDERFFASTRGQVVSLLRQGRHTVDELAGKLGLTDNAVRAHLAALERDGLVTQGELRRGSSKPAFTYELTAEAERLFPKAYGALLHELLGVLGERLPPEALEEALREVGRRLSSGYRTRDGDVRHRVDRAVTLLNNLGGLAEAEEAPHGFTISGCSCPLAAAVEGSPAACLLAEALLTEVIGAPVHQVCDQGPPPRCRFEVRAA